MATLDCPGCGKHYNLKGELGGKAIHCPNCNEELVASLPSKKRPMRETIREELQILSSGQRKAVKEDETGPKVRVAERSAAVPRLSRPVVTGLVLLFAAVACAGGVWTFLRVRGSGPPELPESVAAAIAKARESDLPGREEEALRNWETARRLLLSHLMDPKAEGAFERERILADSRSAELREMIRRRKAGLPVPQDVLAQARKQIEDGKQDEARQKLEELLATLRGADFTPAERDAFAVEANRMLNSRQLAGGTEGGPARPSAPAPATKAVVEAPERKPGPEPKPQTPAPSLRATVPQPAPEPAPEPAPAPARSPGERLKELVESIRTATAERQPRVVVDAPTDILRWRPEAWANPTQLQLERSGGDQALSLTHQPGDKGKWVISIDQPMDLRAYDSLQVDVDSRDALKMSMVLWTGAGGSMFETETQTVRRGTEQTVSFPLKGDRFKSQITQWQFGTDVKDANNVTRLSLFFYNQASAPVRIRNVRLVSDGRTART